MSKKYGFNILIAENKHQFRAVIYLIIAVLNVISTYSLHRFSFLHYGTYRFGKAVRNFSIPRFFTAIGGQH